MLDRVVLRDKGYFRLVHVGDGEEAMNYLSRQGQFADHERFPFPHLVLLDLKMPRISGFDLLSWIRDRTELRRLPVVVLTSSRNKADVNKAYDFGANCYVAKSADPDEFSEVVQTMKQFWLQTNEYAEIAL